MDCYSILMKDSQNNTTLEEQLRDIEAAKEEIYDKRTEHLNKDGSAIFINRLIREDSPYLLQHAHNPVNWYPWGDKPFQIAKEKNIPVLISIGYATCHWCHVMERESFEDAVLAVVLNENFVCIKVDREERPDVDSIYMQALQALGQQGGWPLNVFLTPGGLPFYGGTYFPPERRHNLPSFLDVLQFLIKTWKNEQEKVNKQTQAIVDYIRQSSTREKRNTDLDDLSFDGEEKTQKLFENHYDKLNHGFQFQSNNKFPPSMGLSLLLRHHHRTCLLYTSPSPRD